MRCYVYLRYAYIDMNIYICESKAESTYGRNNIGYI